MTNSRSHSGLKTFTKHRLVCAKLNLQNHSTRRQSELTKRDNQIPVFVRCRDESGQGRHDGIPTTTMGQHRGSKQEAIEEVLGRTESKTKADLTIIKLSAEQLGKQQTSESKQEKHKNTKNETRTSCNYTIK